LLSHSLKVGISHSDLLLDNVGTLF